MPHELDDLDQLHADLDEACRVGDADLAQSIVARMLIVVPEVLQDAPARDRPLVWRADAPTCIARYERVIAKIAAKYTTDDALRQDCAQEARVAIGTLRVERVRGYGTLTGKAWTQALDRYSRTAIRNAVLSYLDPVKTGSWDIGRTRRVRNGRNERIKVHVSPRYSSLDKLVAESGLQVDTTGHITWEHAATAGLGTHERGEWYGGVYDPRDSL